MTPARGRAGGGGVTADRGRADGAAADRRRTAGVGTTADRGRFAGEVALVTGGSSGIGLEIARGLVRGGARVLLVARRRVPLAAAARELERETPEGARDPRVLARAGDLGRATDLRAVAAWARRETPRLDVLVNNAGHLDPRPFERLDDRAWERTLAVNLLAPVRLLRALLPALRRASGARVVNVSSIAGVEGSVKLPGTAAYAASKAGLVALTQVLAVEWEGGGPRINVVSYGSVETAMFRRVAELAKPGMPAAAAARMALFLASRESEPMSGRNVEFWS